MLLDHRPNPLVVASLSLSSHHRCEGKRGGKLCRWVWTTVDPLMDTVGLDDKGLAEEFLVSSRGRARERGSET